MFGLAAVAAMAFVGAGSASAETETQLCIDHDLLACDDPADLVEMLGSGLLLGDPVDVLCLHVYGAATPLDLDNPQQVHVDVLDFNNCGTKSTHSNCDVEAAELPLFNLLKTGLDQGTLTGESGLVLLDCQNIDIFGTDYHCSYNATGLTLSAGAQHLTADDTAVTEEADDTFCPNNPALDMLLVTVEDRYILRVFLA